jgi:hypothetical protein
VPAAGDYDGGEIGGIIGRGNWSTRRKPAPVLELWHGFYCNLKSVLYLSV